MATVGWTQQLDLPALDRVLKAPGGGVVRDLLRRGLLVESAAKRNLSGIGGPKRIDTGRLRASLTTVIVFRNGEPACLVGTNVKYGWYVHEGTGIYGPFRRPIRPRRAKFLRFKPRGSSKWVFARSVKGMVPNPFLQNALFAARG